MVLEYGGIKIPRPEPGGLVDVYNQFNILSIWICVHTLLYFIKATRKHSLFNELTHISIYVSIIANIALVNRIHQCKR